LKTVAGRATRPTPDRLRETLFDVLGPRVQGALFVDAYAGTGAVGIEALSRGAARCVFVEISRRAVDAIRQNLRALGIEGRASVVAGKAVAALGRQSADIVFLDPPYELEQEYAQAIAAADAPLVIAQHSVRFDPGDAHGQLRRVRTLKQGDNVLSFYERLEGAVSYRQQVAQTLVCVWSLYLWWGRRFRLPTDFSLCSAERCRSLFQHPATTREPSP
jgi:16S rRNA (guanine(966)-N(2))-methyltransferase RsmD